MPKIAENHEQGVGSSCRAAEFSQRRKQFAKPLAWIAGRAHRAVNDDGAIGRKAANLPGPELFGRLETAKIDAVRDYFDRIAAEQRAGAGAIGQPVADRYEPQIGIGPVALLATPNRAAEVVVLIGMQLRTGAAGILIAVAAAGVVASAGERPHI